MHGIQSGHYFLVQNIMTIYVCKDREQNHNIAWHHHMSSSCPSEGVGVRWVRPHPPFGCDLYIFYIFFFCLRACYGGWWCTKIPLPRVWKIDPNFLRRLKKKCWESPIQGWRRTLCKIRTPVFKKLLLTGVSHTYELNRIISGHTQIWFHNNI